MKWLRIGVYLRPYMTVTGSLHIPWGAGIYETWSENKFTVNIF
jgi:hypothetical protein